MTKPVSPASPSYDYEKRFSHQPYTLDELEQFWHAQDTSKLCNVDVLEEYEAGMGKLMKQDPQDAVRRVEALTLRLMTGIADKSINTTSAVGKCFRLYKMVRGTMLSKITGYNTDMQYGLSVLLMHQGLACNAEKEPEGSARIFIAQMNVVATNLTLESFFDKEKHPIQLTDSPEPRPSQQLARHLFNAPWCMLVEPELASLDDLVRTIWVDRPQLLTLSANQHHDQAAHTVTLPDYSAF